MISWYGFTYLLALEGCEHQSTKLPRWDITSCCYASAAKFTTCFHFDVVCHSTSSSEIHPLRIHSYHFKLLFMWRSTTTALLQFSFIPARVVSKITHDDCHYSPSTMKYTTNKRQYNIHDSRSNRKAIQTINKLNEQTIFNKNQKNQFSADIHIQYKVHI